MKPENWQYVLQGWAILAPLLTAIGAAVWTRRNFIADRKHETEQQAERDVWQAEQGKVARKEDQEYKHRREKYEELKSAILDYSITAWNYCTDLGGLHIDTAVDYRPRLMELGDDLHQKQMVIFLLVPRDVYTPLIHVSAAFGDARTALLGMSLVDAKREEIVEAVAKESTEIVFLLARYLKALDDSEVA